MAEFSINNPNGYLAGPLGSFRVYGPDGRLKAIGAGGGGGATWGTITGDILNQTDLINYISSQVGSGFVPETRTLTINGTTYDLTADRTWTIPAGGTVTDVTGTGTVSGLTLTGTGTTSVTLTLGGSLVLVASDITTALGYTPYSDTNPAGYINQTTADTLYYPLSANPSNYVTSSALTTVLSNYLTTSAAASTYLTIIDAATTYQPIFTAQNGLTYGAGVLELGGTLVQNTQIDGTGFTFDIVNVTVSDNTAVKSFRFTASNGLDVAEVSVNAQAEISRFYHQDGPTSSETSIELTGTELNVKTPLYSSASVGDVLTLQDPTTGEAEWQTPTGGSSPLTTKGDLYTYDTADARLPVGTNGQVLYADNTTATGLKWDTPPTGGGSIPFAIASGTDTYTATVTGVTGYTDGDAYIIRFTNGNTDASTLNISGVGAKTLYKNNDGPLIGGDIWDGAEMICIYNLAIDGFSCIGTSPNTLYAYVTNVNGSTITRGQAVYAFGGTGNRMTVKLAQANTDATSAQTIGFVFSTSIADNQKGIIIIQGYFIGLSLFPTATWNDGDPVYLSPTTPGAVTKTKPYAPNHLVYLGVVATANNGGAGRMYVRVQNGYELDELHNVQAQNPNLNDTLWYDNTVSPGQWKTASIPTILGATTVGNNLITIPNPSAVSYIRIKSDNTVDTRTPAQVLTDLGVAGTIILNRDFANTYTASTVSTNTVLFSVLIPANTLQVNDWITTRTLSKASSAGGNFYIYINTTATIGGTQLAQWNPSANLSGLFERNFAVGAIGSSGNLKYFNSSMSGISLYSGFNANYVTSTIDTTINQYLVFSASPGTSGTATTYGNLITILR